MPFVVVPKDDPRCKPTAYVSDGVRLYEVIEDERGVLVLENCSTGFKVTISRSAISAYTLVQPAPTPPDYPEASPE